MKIKSEYSSPKQGFWIPLLQVINNNFMTLGVVLVIIIAILAISTPSAPAMEFDCSKLSAEQRLALKTSVDGRLESIKEAMNTSLKSDNGFIRGDMQDTIEQIMQDTRKEYCIPIKE